MKNIILRYMIYASLNSLAIIKFNDFKKLI